MAKVVVRAAFACAILLAHVLYSPAIYAQPRFYVIEPQALEEALFDFAEQAHLSINFSKLDLSDLQSLGTKGHVSKSASLRALLRGTGLGFKFRDEYTVQLYKLAPQGEPVDKSVQAVKAGGGGTIEDLIVTANKRPVTNFELPVSVSAVSSLTLEDLSSYDFQSVAPHLAGVLTTNLGPGRNKIFVRGLSDGVFSDRTQAIVGVYIDEAPVNYSDTNPDLRLFDVERIELLRGPQGTLYGSGSLAGVYRVITRKPELDSTSLRTRVSGSFTKEGGANGTLDFAFNIPIVPDKLAARLTGYADFRSGYIDDINIGLENVNSLKIYGARPAFRWKINETWTLDAVGNLQFIRYADSQYYQSELGRNHRNNVVQEPYGDDFYHVNLTLKGQLSFASLTSSTVFVDRSVLKQVDASDGLPFITHLGQVNSDLFAREDISLFSDSEEFLQLFETDANGYITDDNIRIISHETRLQSDRGERLNWLAGFFYQGRRQSTGSALLYANEEAPDDIQAALAEGRIESSDEFAAFGEATYQFSQKLSVTAGARYSRSLLQLENVSVLLFNEDTVEQVGRKVKHSFIPKLAVKYEWTDDIQTYALGSFGYRIGGLNINTPLAALVAADPDHEFKEAIAKGFQSDNLINGELGLKSFWFDRQLGVNFSAFMVHWYDIQSDQLGPSGLPLTVNVGEARIKGYELEFSARPFAGLEMVGSIFWNDSELVDDNLFLGVKAGNRLPAVPENTASISVLYERDITRNWAAMFQADYAYIGPSALNFNEDSSASMGGYGILNAKIQFTNDKWKLGVYARNLTDTKANTFSFGNGFRLSEGNQVTPPRPLTAGIFLETSF